MHPLRKSNKGVVLAAAQVYKLQAHLSQRQFCPAENCPKLHAKAAFARLFRELCQHSGQRSSELLPDLDLASSAPSHRAAHCSAYNNVLAASHQHARHGECSVSNEPSDERAPSAPTTAAGCPALCTLLKALQCLILLAWPPQVVSECSSVQVEEQRKLRLSTADAIAGLWLLGFRCAAVHSRTLRFLLGTLLLAAGAMCLAAASALSGSSRPRSPPCISTAEEHFSSYPGASGKAEQTARKWPASLVQCAERQCPSYGSKHSLPCARRHYNTLEACFLPHYMLLLHMWLWPQSRGLALCCFSE